MHPILNDIELFCKQQVDPFLDSHSPTKLPEYPEELVATMKQFGLYGINIPKEYGGGKIPPPVNLPINRLFARHWLTLTALYGIHLRANQYFVSAALEAQKQFYLPRLASGEIVITHAFHEKSVRDARRFSTTLSQTKDSLLLNGTKQWVINARHADFMIVIANRDSDDQEAPQCSAVIVAKSMPGVSIRQEHFRQGMHGVSLASVEFDNVEISEDLLIGGLSQCVLQQTKAYYPVPLLSFAARCAGLAESLTLIANDYLTLDFREEASKGIIYYKWSEIQMLKEAIIAKYEHAVSLFQGGDLSKAFAYRTKVFCSRTLNELVEKIKALCGGSSFAGENYRLLQQLNDAGVLSLIDTPNDILLSIAGAEELGS